MQSHQRLSICGTRTDLGVIRRLSGWLAMSIVATGVAGCGMGGTSAKTETAAAPEGSALPANVAATDEPEAARGGNPGIMVTPAGAGGIVVGDPLEGGKAGAVAAPAQPIQRHDEDDPNTVATPAPAEAAPSERPGQAQMTRKKKDKKDKDGDGDEEEIVPQPTVAASEGLEPGDESFPTAPQNVQGGAPLRFGATAADDDKGGFPTNREAAAAEAARAAANGTHADDVAAPPNDPNAARGRGHGKREDGDEDFPAGATAADAGDGQATAPTEIKRGSAEEVTNTFLSLIAAGEIEKAAPLIAGRATGLLAKLRDGTATPEELEELKTAAAVRQQENNRPKGGRHRLITFRADKKMLVVEAEQKDADCCVVKLDVRDASRRGK
jgi:hypothetical protein